MYIFITKYTYLLKARGVHFSSSFQVGLFHSENIKTHEEGRTSVSANFDIVPDRLSRPLK